MSRGFYIISSCLCCSFVSFAQDARPAWRTGTSEPEGRSCAVTALSHATCALLSSSSLCAGFQRDL